MQSATLLRIPDNDKTTSRVYKPSLECLYIHKEVRMIEDVETFAMRVITKRWDMGYWDLLNTVNSLV